MVIFLFAQNQTDSTVQNSFKFCNNISKGSVKQCIPIIQPTGDQCMKQNLGFSPHSDTFIYEIYYKYEKRMLYICQTLDPQISCDNQKPHQHF